MGLATKCVCVEVVVGRGQKKLGSCPQALADIGNLEAGLVKSSGRGKARRGPYCVVLGVQEQQGDEGAFEGLGEEKAKGCCEEEPWTVDSSHFLLVF